MTGSTPNEGATDKLAIPEHVLRVHRRLVEAGHRSLLAGGAVRDHLLGKEPKDFDLATSALPDAVDALFDKTVLVGAQFGVVRIIEAEGEIEVATFRADIGISDGRHPASVRFTDEKEDALRRDFTINGLFWDIDEEQVVDHVGGVADLESGVIRAIGEARDRFKEDRLRMMRAVRFATILDFPMDDATWTALVEESNFIDDVSPERIRDELERILVSPHRLKGYNLLSESGLMRHIMPEIEEMRDVQQPPQFHPEGDVFVHTGLVLSHLEDPSFELAMGALLHDVGKPGTFEEAADRIRFHGHDELGATITEGICDRLHLSNAQSERIVYLVRRHQVFMNIPQMRVARRYRVFEEPGFEELLELCRVDCLGSHADMELYRTCHDMWTEWKALGPPTEPLLHGRDLLALGIEPGPGMGQMLEAVQDAQREGTVTDRDEAIRWVQARLEGQD